MNNYKDDFSAYPKKGAYLDSATVNLIPNSVIWAQSDFNHSLGSTPRKVLYSRSRKTTELYLETKQALANKFGLKPENYAFTPNGDYSWNMILYSLIDYFNENGTKLNIIASIYDHHSLLAPLQYLARMEKIDLVLLTEFDFDNNFSDLINQNTIVAINHTSPILGKYRDIQTLAKEVHSMDGYLAVDYSRSSAQIGIDLINTDISIIDCSQDLLAPQGIGILVLQDNLILSLKNAFPGSGGIKNVSKTEINQLNSIEKFEVGNVNMGGISALNESIDYLNKVGLTNIISHREGLHSYFNKIFDDYDYLKPIIMDDNISLSSSNIISFTMNNTTPHDVVLLLEEISKIEVRSGRLCAHPGLDELNYDDVIQISTHIYNSLDEIDLLFQTIEEIKSIFD